MLQQLKQNQTSQKTTIQQPKSNDNSCDKINYEELKNLIEIFDYEETKYYKKFIAPIKKFQDN
jgi:hypothetical protein